MIDTHLYDYDAYSRDTVDLSQFYCDSQEGFFESKPVRKKLHVLDVVEDYKGLEY